MMFKTVSIASLLFCLIIAKDDIRFKTTVNNQFSYSTIIDTFSYSTSSKNYIHPLTNETDTNIVLPPDWAFGILFGGYTNQAETIERINCIIDHNYPIDAYWIDSWFWSYADKGRGPKNYIDFIGDTDSFPNRKEMWDYFQRNNIKGGFWIWNCIFQTGNEDIFHDFESKGFFKNTYVETNSWHNHSTTTAMFQKEKNFKGTLCGNIDFENPDAVKYFKQKVKPFFDEGADFLKLDRTSAIPVCKTLFEITQEFGLETKGRGFILSHTGGMETEEYKRYPAKWTDDTRSDWTIEKPNKEFDTWVPPISFKENIEMFIKPEKKSSKIPFLTNDTGGFDLGKTKNLDEELFIRWFQFSTFTPIVELFSQPENPASNLPFLYSDRADTLFKKYSHLRMEMFPYIYSYAHKCRLTGNQIMQIFPYHQLEYFFGDEILVAPIYEKGTAQKKILFPEGEWIDFWTNKVYKGDNEYTFDLSIENIPIFVRAGSIIPMRNYSQSIQRGSNDYLTLNIYLGRSSNFTFIEDDGTSNDYLTGIYAKTDFSLNKTNEGYQIIISPMLGHYKNMNQERNWCFKIHTSERVKKIFINKNEIRFKNENMIYTTSYFKSSKYEKNVIDISL